MADLLVIAPSRGRPRNAADLLGAWRQTRTDNSQLLLAVDEDDPELAGYQALKLPEWAELVVGPRERMNPTLNRRALEYVDRHFALGFMGDDHRPRTVGWDGAITVVLREMGSGIVYGNDLIQGAALPTAVFMTSDIVQALGYFAPPGLIHMYADNAWLALGEGLGRLCYLEGVVIEHLHPVAGTAAWDPGYREVNAPEMYERDRNEFRRWLIEDFDDAVARVNEAISGSPAVR